MDSFLELRVTVLLILIHQAFAATSLAALSASGSSTPSAQSNLSSIALSFSWLTSTSSFSGAVSSTASNNSSILSSSVTSTGPSSTSSDIISSFGTSNAASSTSSTVLSNFTVSTKSSSTSSDFISSSTSSGGSSSTLSSIVFSTSSSESSSSRSINLTPSSTLGPQSDLSISSTLTRTTVFPTPPPNLVINAGDSGLITLGPQTSTESGPFTSKQTGVAGLTANSATTTSTDRHNTILPIWFLSGGIGIIQLPGAGIEPGGIIPPPPGFPPLFIGSDGSPTTGGPPEGTKDPQTSSTDDPNSDPQTTPTDSPTSDPKTTPTDSPTSDNPTSTDLTSASSTSSTTSSSSSTSVCSTSCSSCYTYAGDGSPVPADTGGTDDENAAKRSQRTPPPSIAGRISLPHILEKRADDFDTFNPTDKVKICQLSKKIKIPSYPSPGSLPKKVSAGAQLWFVMTETTAPNTCPVLDYRMVSDADVTSQKINPADANTYVKIGNWVRTNPTVNVDHVYELSILKQFFESRVTAANCGDFKAIFESQDTGSPQVQGDTRLQTIWRQLPSNINPDFAGMDAKINAIKAQAFSFAFSNPSGSGDSLGYLYQLALAMKITNDPLVAPLFMKANNRIYAALLAMDAIIASNGNSGSIQPDWASSYRTFITGLLTSSGTKVNGKVSAILNNNNQLGTAARVGPGSTTGVDGQATATTNSIGRGVTAFLQAYPTPDSFTFEVGNLVSFPSSSTANIKRQACTKSPVSLSAPPPTSITPSSISTSSVVPISSSEPLTIIPVTENSTPIPITIIPVTSSASVLPNTCPAGCECIKALQGGCDCLCS